MLLCFRMYVTFVIHCANTPFGIKKKNIKRGYDMAWRMYCITITRHLQPTPTFAKRDWNYCVDIALLIEMNYNTVAFIVA